MTVDSKFLVMALLGFLASCTAPVPVPEGTTSYALTGAHWFDGDGFSERTVWVVGDALVDRRPERVDSVLDLSGRWIVPPFGDAHTHNLDGPYRLDEVRAAYRAEGTFYVQVLTNTASGAAAVRDSFSVPGTLDVRYANGGITSTLGHPFLAYEPRAIGVYTPADLEARYHEVCASRRLDGNAYWFLDTPAELDSVWAGWRADGGDALKVFLLHSGDRAPSTACEGMGERGLDPALIAPLVRRAHDAGIPVWAHIESAHDFDVAVRAGVDGVAHVPGYLLSPDEDPDEYLIPPASAGRAGARGVAVTPTLDVGGLYIGRDDTAAVNRMWRLQRQNLQRLREAGASVVVGSDAYGRTARSEVEALRALGLWSDLELLRMWSVTTPQTIFPDRRIGVLDDGYEASLLALACNPLEDWTCTREITLRVKDGRVLEAR